MKPADAAVSKPLEELKLAVVIPLFNRRELVLETLASVARQTMAPWRVVVVDDGSSDGSPEAVISWLADHPLGCPVEVIRQPNAGVSAARNRGAAAAEEADLLAFLDSDDLWPGDFVAAALTVFRQDPALVGAAARSEVMECRPDGTIRTLPGRKPWPQSPRNPVRLVFRAFPGTLAMVVRSAVFRRFGGFPVGVQLGEDAVFFLLAATAGRWGTLPCGPVTIRRGEIPAGCQAQLTQSTSTDAVVSFAASLDLGAQVHGLIRPLRAALARRWVKAGVALAAAGRREEACECLRNALLYQSWNLRTRLRMWCLAAGPPGAPSR